MFRVSMSEVNKRGINNWGWRRNALAGCLLIASILIGLSFGPIHLPFWKVAQTLLGGHGLKGGDRIVLLQLRLPRVLLAVIVGSALSASGAVYQTVFRNPLADPYLLGTAAGAGLGATIAITSTAGQIYTWLPLAAFAGAVLAVLITFVISGRFVADPATLLLSGIAVGSFSTAIQTYLQQRHSASLRPIYSWLLGELTAASWPVVMWSGIYVGIALLVLFVIAGRLDGLLLSDEEAFSLGLNPQRLRLIAIFAATLATASAVSASGLIGFVGIVIPHLVRGITHSVTNRSLIAIAMIGAAFLVIADLGARTLLSPAEIPIGVLTAFVGAPFFLMVLRNRRLALRG